MSESIVGVIGGMGPAATVNFMQRIIDATPARDDADHIHMLVDNNPHVPSRLKALLDDPDNGENPGPYLAEMAYRLEQAGADFLVIPCNTAHYYLAYAQNAVSIPVWNMIDLSAAHIAQTRNKPNHKPNMKIGLLASTAIQKLNLFEPVLHNHGLSIVYPEATDQHAVMDIIRAVKRNRVDTKEIQAYNQAIATLEDTGVSGLLLGCTELSIVAPKTETQITVFDSVQILAEAIIRHVKHGASPPN